MKNRYNIMDSKVTEQARPSVPRLVDGDVAWWRAREGSVHRCGWRGPFARSLSICCSVCAPGHLRSVTAVKKKTGWCTVHGVRPRFFVCEKCMRKKSFFASHQKRKKVRVQKRVPGGPDVLSIKVRARALNASRQASSAGGSPQGTAGREESVCGLPLREPWRAFGAQKLRLRRSSAARTNGKTPGNSAAGNCFSCKLLRRD